VFFRGRRSDWGVNNPLRNDPSDTKKPGLTFIVIVCFPASSQGAFHETRRSLPSGLDGRSDDGQRERELRVGGVASYRAGQGFNAQPAKDAKSRKGQELKNGFRIVTSSPGHTAHPCFGDEFAKSLKPPPRLGVFALGSGSVDFGPAQRFHCRRFIVKGRVPRANQMTEASEFPQLADEALC
jgi:hypothetical protein